MAFAALLASKLRSALTILGIVIGVAAEIALVSLGAGVQGSIADEIQSIGSNQLYVMQGSIRDFAGGSSRMSPLTREDANALLDPRRAPHVREAKSEISLFSRVSAGGVSRNVGISGVEAGFFEMVNRRVALGRGISERDVDTRAAVCVLGPELARDLFPDDIPVGMNLRLDGTRFTVIGVMEARGGSAFGNFDSTVYVPITTAGTRLSNARTPSGALSVTMIWVEAADEDSMTLATEEIKSVLRDRHRLEAGDKDDFSVVNQVDITAVFGQITGLLTTFIGAVAAIALLVGGIGIMNIMLVSVTERTREIGVRKALGAKRRDILLQFLVEAVVLSLIGGLMGVLLGWVLANQVSRFLAGVVPIITTQTIALATGVSAIVGVFFGIYPARRAASLNPIEALRYE